MENLEPPRLVLVEDSEPERSLLRTVLEHEGIEIVGEAAGGEQGVAVTLEVRPDVVLMDLRMPEVGGIEATRRIKEALPATQVIILTVYEDSFLRRSTEQVGAYAYLVKGCSPGFMADVIRRAREYALGVKRHLEATEQPVPSLRDSG